MKKKETIIYNNYDLEAGRTEEQLKADMREFYMNNDIEFNDEIFENEKYAYLNKEDEWNWDDAQYELDDIQEKINGNYILMYGTFGGWMGRERGAKVMQGKLSDMMYSSGSDYYKIYIDENGELVNKNSHHDGTNYYKYRMFNEKVLDIEGARGIYVEDKRSYDGRRYIEITLDNEEQILKRYTKKIGTEYQKAIKNYYKNKEVA